MSILLRRGVLISPIAAGYETLQLDSSAPDKYATVAYNAAMDTATLSYFQWVRFQTDSTTDQIAIRSGVWNLRKYENAPSDIRLQLTATVGAGANVYEATITSFSENKWYHLGFTYDASTVKLYVDGVEELSTTSAGAMDSTTNNLYIGATSGGSAMNGSCTLPLFYDAVINQTRIDELQTPKDPSLYTQTNLIGGFPLNAGSGTPLADTTGTLADAALQGGATITGAKLAIEQVSGPVEADYNSFAFASSKEVTTSYVSTNDLTNKMTASVWAYNSATSTNAGLFSNWNGSGWLLLWNGATDLTFYINGSNTTGVTVTQNAWHHIVGTYDGTTARLYVDGVEVATVAVSGNIGTPLLGITLELGRYAGSSSYFIGDITSPILFDRDFSAAEVSDLYQAGKTAYFETLPTSMTDNAIWASELSSRDDSATDLTSGGNDGTKVGGIAANGTLQTFTPYAP